MLKASLLSNAGPTQTKEQAAESSIVVEAESALILGQVASMQRSSTYRKHWVGKYGRPNDGSLVR